MWISIPVHIIIHVFLLAARSVFFGASSVLIVYCMAVRMCLHAMLHQHAVLHYVLQKCHCVSVLEQHAVLHCVLQQCHGVSIECTAATCCFTLRCSSTIVFTLVATAGGNVAAALPDAAATCCFT